MFSNNRKRLPHPLFKYLTLNIENKGTTGGGLFSNNTTANTTTTGGGLFGNVRSYLLFINLILSSQQTIPPQATQEIQEALPQEEVSSEISLAQEEVSLVTQQLTILPLEEGFSEIQQIVQVQAQEEVYLETQEITLVQEEVYSEDPTITIITIILMTIVASTQASTTRIYSQGMVYSKPLLPLLQQEEGYSEDRITIIKTRTSRLQTTQE